MYLDVDVLQLVAQGLGNQGIADKLFIGEATVRSHVSNILSKLHLASRTQAALYALREGYASLDHWTELSDSLINCVERTLQNFPHYPVG